ncbi:MAG: laccase domain-containing protein [Deltaproteobacteria bacterium]|nr:laccase domain-containing protein [Deltaproteobacteria bacterium]
MSFDNKHINKTIISDCRGQIPVLQFDSLTIHPNISHGVFTRKGGVSRPPYDSLNVSYNTGDLHERVACNLNLIKERIGARRIMCMHQVHGTGIFSYHKDNYIDTAATVPTADAIITDVPLLGVMVKQADCQGVIIYDPLTSVVSVVHCGWRGNVRNILGAAVKRMGDEFGCHAEDLKAAIGPSLGPCCAEFKTYGDIFPEEFMRYRVREDHFNLWDISRMQLMRSGLAEENIEIAGICTKCNTDLFFSYRAEGDTGRFGTVAMIK